MATKNTDLIRMARRSLKGKMFFAMGTYFCTLAIIWVVIYSYTNTVKFNLMDIYDSNFLLYLLGLDCIVFLLYGPIFFGWARFGISISRNQDISFKSIFSGFKYYPKSAIAFIMMSIFVGLWSVLLIVPGIVKSLSYSMTFYILSEDTSLSSSEALDKSKKMMDGYKWKYFKLQLWFLLSLLTLIPLFLVLILIAFILLKFLPRESVVLISSIIVYIFYAIWILFFFPYFEVSKAKFYDDIKENPISDDNEIESSVPAV
jgi:uncharacterized membrane protein